MSDQVIGTRLANALVEDAEVSLPDLPGLKSVVGMDAVAPVLAVFKRAYGGLWVGGRATLTATDISFHPNAMNRAVQTGSLDYELLVAGGVTHTGQRILREETVRTYTARAILGFDRTNRVPMTVGRGFLVGAPWPTIYGWTRTSGCFGHAGAFDTLGFGDHATGIAAGIVTNGNAGPMDFFARFRPLVTLLRKACVT